MRNLPYPGSLSKRLGMLATILSAGILLGACARFGGLLASSDVGEMSDVTGSIGSPGTPQTPATGGLPSLSSTAADIDSTDRQVIALALASAPAPGRAIALPWLNPQSGNSGTITALTEEGKELLGCVAFRTTANTIQGVRAYDGNACRDARQQLAVINLAEVTR